MQYRSVLPAQSASHKRKDSHEQGHIPELKLRAYNIEWHVLDMVDLLQE